jgi:CheY-like chemotaxis protein
MKIKPADFLTEIENNIKEQDAIKAGIVLSHIAEMNLEIQKEALERISISPPDFAIPLMTMVLDKFPYLTSSFPDLKERLVVRILEAPAIYLELLQDRKCESRCFLIELAGEIGLEDAYHILMALLVNEDDHEILKQVIISLGEIGDPEAAANIAELLYTEDRELVEAAIRALGLLGSSTAINRLNEKLGQDQAFDMLILDVFMQVQSREAIEKLNRTLLSHHAHIRSGGKERLVRLGDKALPILTENLVHDDPDLLIHTLNILGEIGDERAISAIRKLIHRQPRDANVRFAAYEALGMLPLARGAYVLASGLHDPVDNVRSAAAAAINRNYNEILAAGLKNMLHIADDEAIQLVYTIIATQSGTIFLDLMAEEFFRRHALAYLKHKAHPEVRDYFHELLRENDFTTEATELEERPQLETEVVEEEVEKRRIVAIDDSKMILGIYRSMLHALGYEPFIFMEPEQAVEEVKKLRPDAVLTDLNMPGITGIEVTRRLRQSFTSEELPIIMVTTQNESQDNESAKAAGINEIIHKPFTKDDIGSVLERYLG